MKYIEKIIEIFPKSERILKDRMIYDLYEILELIYMSNIISERKIYQSKIIAKLKMLDFYLSQSLEKNYINYEKYNKCGNFLIKIVNLTEAWMISTNKKYLIESLDKIKNKIEKYKLKTNNKTQIINVSKNGVDFIGFHYYVKNRKIIMKLRNSTKTKLKHAKKKQSHQNSYKTHLKYGNCYNLYNKYMG